MWVILLLDAVNQIVFNIFLDIPDFFRKSAAALESNFPWFLISNDTNRLWKYISSSSVKLTFKIFFLWWCLFTPNTDDFSIILLFIRPLFLGIYWDWYGFIILFAYSTGFTLVLLSLKKSGFEDISFGLSFLLKLNSLLPSINIILIFIINLKKMLIS